MLHVLVTGLNSSAVFVLTGLLSWPVYPPATKTFPSGNNEVVCLERAIISGLVNVQVSGSRMDLLLIFVKSSAWFMDENSFAGIKLKNSLSFWQPVAAQKKLSR
jgi:hypothetical protein